MPNVLITGARAPVAVDCARAFRAAGFDVHLADSVTPWAARMSRARWDIHRLPPPRHQFAAFSAALRGLVERLKPAMVIPTCEEIFYVSAALHGRGVQLFAPELSVLRTLHSKFAFASLLRDLGIEGPETVKLQGPSMLRTLDTRKIVLKPEFSRFGCAAFIRAEPARIAALRPSVDNPWVAQKFVDGDEISSWSTIVNGRVTAHVTYRPVWRQGNSASFAFEVIDQADVEDIAAKIAAATGMTGHLGMDLIVSAGRALPIECNPRAVSGLHLFDADADMAYAMLGQAEMRPPVGRLRYLAPAMLILGLPQAICSGTMAALFRDWKQGSDAIGRGHDWPAHLGVLMDAVRFALLGISRRRSPSAQTTDDIEWNGEALL